MRESGKIDNEIREGLYCCLFVWCLSVSQVRKENSLSFTFSPSLFLSADLCVLVSLKERTFRQNSLLCANDSKGSHHKTQEIVGVGGARGDLKRSFTISQTQISLVQEPLVNLFLLCDVFALHDTSLYSTWLLHPTVLHRCFYKFTCLPSNFFFT